MSALVKVWNDNEHPHTEKFKGKLITIAPGQHVEMDYMDAVDFLGQFVPPIRTDSGDDPTRYKMLRIEGSAPEVKERPVNHVTGETFADPGQLAAFMRAFAAANPDRLAKDAGLDQAGDKVTVSKADFDALVAKVSALESKKGPGRPKKEA